MGLFQLGNFKLASGAESRWKIDCDALTADDWAALALMASEILPPFQRVVGVPRGGLPFARALQKYATGDRDHEFLVADDVVTTGASIERFLDTIATPIDTDIGAVAAFARGPVPPGVVALFQMPVKATPSFEMLDGAE